MQRGQRRGAMGGGRLIWSYYMSWWVSLEQREKLTPPRDRNKADIAASLPTTSLAAMSNILLA